jgi:hypothetical protein
MNKASKPTSPIAAALVIVGIAMAYSAPSFAEGVDGELLAMKN